MSILNSASSRSVYRGYDYYKEGNVISYTQISDFEYEGEVQGTNKTPYHVIIDTKHPKSSSCDCPFANGNTICKHMVALFFAVSPEDLKDYEDWSENDYEDEYEYDDYEEGYYDTYDEYDRYNNYREYKSNFVKPIFFDEILSNFINNLSEDKLRSILMNELKRNEEYTFNNYLKEEFQKYSKDEKNIHAILDKIHSNFYKLSHDYDYNNKDYTIKLLSKIEKEKIQNAYSTDISMKNNIDKVILNPELATYDNYKWIAALYKKYNSKKDIETYIEKLTSFLDTLKHYSIKNTIPKSNVLITIHILSNYSLQESAKLLIKNCKYEEYVDYMLDNYNDLNKLYKIFDKNVENEKYINKEFIPQIYYKFYFRLEDDEIYEQYSYYSFLYNKNIRYLLALKDSPKFEYYINRLINNTKDVIALENIYIFLNRKEELFKLLFKKENEYRLIANIKNLKDDYNNELLTYLKSRFYEVVDAENDSDGEKIVKFLKAKGIKQINYLIGTHIHKDHIGGVADIVDNVKVEKIYMPYNDIEDANFYTKVKNSIKNKGLSIETIKQNDKIYLSNNCSIKILYVDNNEPSNPNNASIVIQTEYEKQKYLFMGDAEKEVETKLLKEGILEDIDVLKVGHHGSQTSSTEEFINKILPEISIVSVQYGRYNNMPSENVINRLKSNENKVYITDKDGTIWITSDGITNFVTILKEVNLNGANKLGLRVYFKYALF